MLKKIEVMDQQLQQKVDALAADVVFLKELSKHIGAALGVLRREDVDK